MYALENLVLKRLTEKEFLGSLNIPIAPYMSIETANDLRTAHMEFKDCIIKTRTLGYDGKGQKSIKNQNNYSEIFEKIKLKSIIEKFFLELPKLWEQKIKLSILQ